MIQAIGPHRVRHGSIMDSVGIAELMGADKADIVYSDPPWGMGNLKFWATMNRKMTGATTPQAPTLEAFLEQVFAQAKRYCRGIFLVEYGVRWEQQIIDQGGKHGFLWQGRATPVYASQNLPLHLHLFSTHAMQVPAGYFKALDGTKGFKTVMQRSMTIPLGLAKCSVASCGLGYSAKMALAHKMSFRGNELNAKRLAKTVERLSFGVAKMTLT